MDGYSLKTSRRLILWVFCLFLTLSAASTIASAAGYSADVVTTNKSGTSQSKMRVS
jgi:hypothetical protein